MKYLVNRETKEHKILTDSMVWAHGDWRMVDADDEGWIKWKAEDYSVCPLPDDEIADILLGSGTRGTCRAGSVLWTTLEGSEVISYRPVLPAESKPTLENTWDIIEKAAKVDVFTRLYAAVAASESIPALIAEINAMLPEGYQVVKFGIDWAGECKPKPAEDVSDWRNWKEGDMVTCVNGSGWSEFCVGGDYVVTWRSGSDLFINGINVGIYGGDFKFHSRPEAK